MKQSMAEKRWCPMVRVSEGDSVTNRSCDAGFVSGTDIPWNSCIGALCMMWRWEDISKREGYCGLAGKP